jgi:glycosyltransferase EpsD
MKILFVSTTSATINSFLVPHIEMLLDSGHQVDMACNISKPISPILLERGCRVFPMSFQRSPLKKNNFVAYRNLKKLIEGGEYDLVHTHTPIASTLARLACSRGRKGVKVIYTAHGFHFFEGAPLKNWLTYYPIENWLGRYTDVLVTMNKEDYERAKKKFKSKKIRLVNGVGVNLNKFAVQTEVEKNRVRQEYGIDPETFILVYAAELTNRKHQDLLISVMDKLVRDIPNSKLLLIGKGPNQEQYQSLINKLQLNDHIELMGFRGDVDKLMMIADVAVSSSRQEGLPVNVMEAMATGLPLVVSGCRGNSDLVKDGKNGFVIYDGLPEHYAEKILRIYSDRELRSEMKNANLADIQKYSTENVLKEMDEIYKELLV